MGESGSGSVNGAVQVVYQREGAKLHAVSGGDSVPVCGFEGVVEEPSAVVAALGELCSECAEITGAAGPVELSPVEG